MFLFFWVLFVRRNGAAMPAVLFGSGVSANQVDDRLFLDTQRRRRAEIGEAAAAATLSR